MNTITKFPAPRRPEIARDIEITVKFEADWNYELQFDAHSVSIDIGCGSSMSLEHESFERIIKEYQTFKRLQAEARKP